MKEPAKIAVISSLRDGASYLPTFYQMVKAFDLQPTHLILAENDSIDDSAAIIAGWPDAKTLTFTTGIPHLGRVSTRERTRYLALVYNRTIEFALSYDWDYAYLTSVQKF